MDWKEGITTERSRFQAYLKARKAASTRSNRILAGIVFFAIAAGLTANASYGLQIASYASLITCIRAMVDAGFTFTTSILGFLIAGSSIFASITKPDFFAGAIGSDKGKYLTIAIYFL